ncbi:hypothetical protein J1605_009152 [Eschrichtius robustus]|uniref:Uncharacterized protein n=1 Tax=Eschrichtius robustus TaxID=9764 RepID=A0AB34GWA7_ESCRO|nr:hypothetical protein J1605_009152 [Eschrichtius robustus]
MLAPPGGRLLHSAEWAPSSPAPGNPGSERHSHLGALVIAHQPANTETLGHGLPRAGASQCLLKSPQFWEVGGPEPDRGGCPERRPSMGGLAPACGHGRGPAHAYRQGVGMCAGAAGAGSVGRKLLGERLAAGPRGRAARLGSLPRPNPCLRSRAQLTAACSQEVLEAPEAPSCPEPPRGEAEACAEVCSPAQPRACRAHLWGRWELGPPSPPAWLLLVLGPKGFSPPRRVSEGKLWARGCGGGGGAGHLGRDSETPRIPGSASLSWDGSGQDAPVVVRPEEGPLSKVEVFGLDFVSPSPRVQATPEPQGCQAGSRMGTLACGPGGGAGAPRGHRGPSSRWPFSLQPLQAPPLWSSARLRLGPLAILVGAQPLGPAEVAAQPQPGSQAPLSCPPCYSPTTSHCPSRTCSGPGGLAASLGLSFCRALLHPMLHHPAGAGGQCCCPLSLSQTLAEAC